MNIYPLSVDEQNIELERKILESEVDYAIPESVSFFESYVWQLWANAKCSNNAPTDRNIWQVCQ